MPNRGTLYVSLLLIAAGLYLLLINLAEPLLGLGWPHLWPGFLALAALAFYLPVFVWWERRYALSGLAVPGTILTVNALIFFYNALTGDWDAWAYLWSLEPLAVGLGLFLTWLIGPRNGAVLTGAAAVGSVGLFLFAVFGTAFGTGLARVVAPIVLIGLGLSLLLRGLIGRAKARPGLQL